MAPMIRLLRICDADEKLSLPYVCGGMYRAQWGIKMLFRRKERVLISLGMQMLHTLFNTWKWFYMHGNLVFAYFEFVHRLKQFNRVYKLIVL